ncbi:UNVERIFIED_ORG: tetratricopeptide (TPR) repeat protein [Pseudomonas vranovensis]|nr:tetratricopeptide (TPR) repeat protein [Pseudomonas vranovensis]
MMPGLYDGLAEVLVALGESKRAQGVLEEAVRLSPLAVRRQMMLGKLALSNDDYDTSSKAYRHAVNQGQSSRYKDPESNLGLVQALMNKNAGNGLDARTRVEINTVLSEVAKENVEDQGLQVRARLMKAASLQQAGDAETAAKLTEQAMARLEKNGPVFLGGSRVGGGHAVAKARSGGCRHLYSQGLRGDLRRRPQGHAERGTTDR